MKSRRYNQNQRGRGGLGSFLSSVGESVGENVGKTLLNTAKSEGKRMGKQRAEQVVTQAVANAPNTVGQLTAMGQAALQSQPQYQVQFQPQPQLQGQQKMKCNCLCQQGGALVATLDDFASGLVNVMSQHAGVLYNPTKKNLNRVTSALKRMQRGGFDLTSENNVHSLIFGGNSRVTSKAEKTDGYADLESALNDIKDGRADQSGGGLDVIFGKTPFHPVWAGGQYGGHYDTSDFYGLNYGVDYKTV